MDMKMIDLLLEEEKSEREKQMCVKKSLIIYKLFRKKIYNDYGIKFSWVLSNDVEAEYHHYDGYTNRSVAAIYPKDVKIKLLNDKAINEYKTGDLSKQDFLFIIESYIEPIVKIKLVVRDENIFIEYGNHNTGEST